jgi:AMIN domain
MDKLLQIMARLALVALLFSTSALLAQSSPPISIRHVKVLGSKDAVEVEVEASARVTPQTRVLTGPDRLVIDFPNAIPGKDLRSQSVDQGDVKDIRVGLFQGKPAVTRIVLDLKRPQSYQIFPGQSVMIKVMGDSAGASAVAANYSPGQSGRPALVTANFNPGAAAVQMEPVARPALEVSYRGGLLSVHADKVTLSEVLSAVQQRTGAEVGTAPGADQERVVVDIGPAPAAEVMAKLLYGSNFNFLIVGAANDPRQLARVILSPRGEGGAMPLAPIQNDFANNANSDANSDDDDPSTRPAQPGGGPPMPIQVPQPQPEAKAPGDNTPDQ